jgi:hypothetical protein
VKAGCRNGPEMTEPTITPTRPVARQTRHAMLRPQHAGMSRRRSSRHCPPSPLHSSATARASPAHLVHRARSGHPEQDAIGDPGTRFNGRPCWAAGIAPPAAKWVVAPLPLPLGGMGAEACAVRERLHLVHPTHFLVSSAFSPPREATEDGAATLLLCLKCGYHATTHVRAVRQPCPGKRGANTDYVLRQAVTRKRHPVSGALLHCSRIIGTNWRADATASPTRDKGNHMPVLGPRAKRRRVGLVSGSEPDSDPPTPWPLEDLEHELGLLARFEAEAAEDECQRHSLCEQPVRSCGDPPP